MAYTIDREMRSPLASGLLLNDLRTLLRYLFEERTPEQSAMASEEVGNSART